MQNGKSMDLMMRDQIQYIMMPKIRYAPWTGTYASYDIAAYDTYRRGIAQAIPDVTPDRELALHIVETFNRTQLPPCRLYDAIAEMVSGFKIH